QHFVIGGGDEPGKIEVVVASRHGVRHAGCHRRAHGFVQSVAVAVPAIAIVYSRTAQAHVGNLDVETGCVCSHPVEAANDRRPGAGALVVEHADRVDGNSWRHAHDASAIVDRADGS